MQREYTKVHQDAPTSHRMPAHSRVTNISGLGGIGLGLWGSVADRQEGRRPYDVATDVLATIECVLEDDLRPAIETLQRSASVTDTELERQFQDWRKRKCL
jgi:hypothetical protein